MAGDVNDGADQTLLFFTCATRFYENFVIPYVFFARTSNENSLFEFVVDDRLEFIRKNQAALDWLKANMGVEPVLRSKAEFHPLPRLQNSIRFTATPLQTAPYVYIGDVDIMITEAILPWHKPIFDAGLPYSNTWRAKDARLTGLHLTTYDAYYPLPPIDDLIAKIANDEELLYAIVERKGQLYDVERYKAAARARIRPIHGIHMSLNRLPFSYHAERVGWGISYRNAMATEAILSSDAFQDFFKTLYPGAAQIFVNLIFICKGVSAYGERFFRSVVR